MFKIKFDKKKFNLVMTQDEQDENFENALRKFEDREEFQNALKDLRVKVTTDGTTSEFSTEIQPEEDLAEYAKKLVIAKMDIYNLLHRLELEEEAKSKTNTGTSFYDKLLDKVAVIALTKVMFEDEPGTQCPTEEG